MAKIIESDVLTYYIRLLRSLYCINIKKRIRFEQIGNALSVKHLLSLADIEFTGMLLKSCVIKTGCVV